MTSVVEALQPVLWFKLDEANTTDGATVVNSTPVPGAYTGRPWYYSGDTIQQRNEGLSDSSAGSILLTYTVGSDGGWLADFVDTFDRTPLVGDQPLDTTWTVGRGTIIDNHLAGGELHARGTTAGLNYAFVSTSVRAYTDDQAARVVFSSGAVGDTGGAVLRGSGTTGYAAYYHFITQKIYIVKFSGNTETWLAESTGTMASPGQFVFEASGEILRVTDGAGTEYVATTDATHTSGQPGIYFRFYASGAGRVANFEAGDYLPGESAEDPHLLVTHASRRGCDMGGAVTEAGAPILYCIMRRDSSSYDWPIFNAPGAGGWSLVRWNLGSILLWIRSPHLVYISDYEISIPTEEVTHVAFKMWRQGDTYYWKVWMNGVVSNTPAMFNYTVSPGDALITDVSVIGTDDTWAFNSDTTILDEVMYWGLGNTLTDTDIENIYRSYAGSFELIPEPIEDELIPDVAFYPTIEAEATCISLTSSDVSPTMFSSTDVCTELMSPWECPTLESWSQPELCSKMPCAAPVAARPRISDRISLGGVMSMRLGMTATLTSEAASFEGTMPITLGMTGAMTDTLLAGELGVSMGMAGAMTDTLLAGEMGMALTASGTLTDVVASEFSEGDVYFAATMRHAQPVTAIGTLANLNAHSARQFTNYNNVAQDTTTQKFGSSRAFSAANKCLYNGLIGIETGYVYGSAQQRSFDIWFYPTAINATNNTLWAIRDSSFGYNSPGQLAQYMCINAAGKLSFQTSTSVQLIGSSGGSMSTVEGTTTITTNQWYYVRVVVATSGTVKMYLWDGTTLSLEGTGSTVADPGIGSRTFVTLGGVGNLSVYPFSGRLEGFGIYSKAYEPSAAPTNIYEALNYEKWDTFTGATISNSDRTLTQSSPSTAVIGIGRGKIPRTGKYYMEAEVSDTVSMLIGLGIVTPAVEYVVARSNANTALVAAGVSMATQQTWAAGRMMLAFDWENKRMWLGRNGTWFSSGDPAAGTNPYYSNMPAKDWYLMTHHDNDGNGNSTTVLHMSSGNLSYSPPSGFSLLV